METYTDTSPYRAPRSDVAVGAADGYGDISIFSARGRLNRLRYLAYVFGLSVLINLITVPLIMAVTFAGGDAQGPLAVAVQVLSSIVGLWIVIVLAIQRLHDFDASGWWSLLLIVPLVNMVLGLVLLFRAGTPGGNRFGLQPPPNTTGVKIVAGIAIALVVLSLAAVVLVLVLGGVDYFVPQAGQY